MNRVKKYIVPITMIFALTITPTKKSNAFIWVVVKTVLKKVIMALDLQVQRIQNKTIALQNIQKELENELSKLKLSEIANWTQKQKDLYEQYFDELWKVKSVITYFKKITDIINRQKELINEYTTTFRAIQQDKHFSKVEVNYMYSVYSGIIDESIKNIDQILMLVKSFNVQMSDGQRLELLNLAADQIEKNISDLRAFSNQNIQLSLKKAKNLDEINAIRQLYGL